MNTDKLTALQRIYELETELFDSGIKEQALSQKYAQAKYHQRQCRSRAAEYEGFSLKGMLDRLRGCGQQQKEQYQKDLRNADAGLLEAQRELERMRRKRQQLQSERESLPSPEAIRDWIGEDTAGQELWMRLDALYCITRLTPLLDENLLALQTARKVLRGDTLGEILTFEEQQKRLTAPDPLAQQCKVWLERMKTALDALRIPFASEPYFRGPAAFLANATKYTRIDRFCQAIEQVENTKKTLQALHHDLKISE